MDWKDILSAKVAGGELPEPEATVNEETSETTASAKKETLHVLMERKGRGGKTATIVEGFESSEEEVRAVAAKLKSKLGTGGSARGGEILIQGDRRADVKKLLQEMGYKVKGV